jgi:topoisomerase IA-like protein
MHAELRSRSRRANLPLGLAGDVISRPDDTTPHRREQMAPKKKTATKKTAAKKPAAKKTAKKTTRKAKV